MSSAELPSPTSSAERPQSLKQRSREERVTDRFRIIIDPGTLETSETMTLEVTTESGATTEIRISIPNTLAGESAVQV